MSTTVLTVELRTRPEVTASGEERRTLELPNYGMFALGALRPPPETATYPPFFTAFAGVSERTPSALVTITALPTVIELLVTVGKYGGGEFAATLDDSPVTADDPLLGTARRSFARAAHSSFTLALQSKTLRRTVHIAAEFLPGKRVTQVDDVPAVTLVRERLLRVMSAANEYAVLLAVALAEVEDERRTGRTAAETVTAIERAYAARGAFQAKPDVRNVFAKVFIWMTAGADPVRGLPDHRAWDEALTTTRIAPVALEPDAPPEVAGFVRYRARTTVDDLRALAVALTRSGVLTAADLASHLRRRP